MDYSKLSNGEISVLLGKALKPKYEVEISEFDSNGAQLVWNWFGKKQTIGYFPLRSAEQLFPVLRKNKIGIAPEGKTTWRAFSSCGIEKVDKNPLKAIAIVFLMMNESNGKQ